MIKLGVWLLSSILFFCYRVDALKLQASAWGSYSFGLKPVPEKLDSSSKSAEGGPGGGADFTAQYFFPFYFGVTAEYFPIYSEAAVYTLEELGVVDVKASLSAARIQGLFYFPVGEWLSGIESTNSGVPFWQRLLHGFFATVSYGPNFFRAKTEVQSVGATSTATRMGWSFGAGISYAVTEQAFLRLHFETMRIIEAEISISSLKAGVVYRISL